MGRDFLALILALGAAIGAARAQSCEEDLPAALTNYSGLACTPVWNNFILRYSKDQDDVLSIVLSTTYATGWVGMGFSKDGMMVGSSAMVGWMGKTGIPHIEQYYLGGKSSSEVKLNQGQLLTTSIQPTVVVQKAKIYIAFQLKFSAPITQQKLLFALGTKIPVNKRLTIHDDKTSISFDFSAGTSSAPSSYPSTLKRTHGALAIFGWGVLLPIGAIVARYCRQWDPLWYYLHVVIQFIGFVFGLAAVVAGVALYDKLHANVTAHRGIGIFVLVLGILQVIAFFLRPGKDSKIRKYWNWYHQWAGRLALFFAAVNIVLGIKVGGAGSSWKIGYGFNLAILLIASIVLEVLLWTRWSKRSAAYPTY
ncbi:cytochrome b561 and DOMON domain-containing protein At3g61750 [Elaeis guineensis]|uniref:Cytochrome b561 and DOMON domain-containing protein At3g61750-like n=1 Tax=Elaeis guineensis var. tenera TaxID=51953 RepID=A0A8N4F5X1_ELAGV|nr:cytochrome b561 and DOMON domain-containing protein At3g61750-like [Elaeis guineensis]